MNEFNSEPNQIDDNPTTQEDVVSKRPSVFLIVLLIILGLTIFLAFVVSLNSKTNESVQTPIVSDTDTDTDTDGMSEEEETESLESLSGYFTDIDSELTDAERQAELEELGSQSQ